MKKIIFIILLIIFILPNYILLGSTKNSLQPTHYEKVLIKSGDSLYSISYTYNTSNMTDKEFVKYIKKFNGLKSNDIYYGNSIIIPMYDGVDNIYEYADSESFN